MGRAGAAAGRAGEEEVKVYDLIDLSDEPDLVDMETWVLELVVVREVKAEPSGDDDNRGGSLPQAVKEEEGEEAREDNLMEDVPMPDGDGDGLGASSDEEEEPVTRGNDVSIIERGRAGTKRRSEGGDEGNSGGKAQRAAPTAQVRVPSTFTQ